MTNFDEMEFLDVNEMPKETFWGNMTFLSGVMMAVLLVASIVLIGLAVTMPVVP